MSRNDRSISSLIGVLPGQVNPDGLIPFVDLSENNPVNRNKYVTPATLAFQFPTEQELITAVVDGTPGPNEMPGALTFRTTPAGSSAPTERARLDNSGNLLVGTTVSPSGSGNIVATGKVTAVNGIDGGTF